MPTRLSKIKRRTPRLPTDPVEVDVFIDAIDDLASYEVALDVSGGTAGELVLTSIEIRSEDPAYVFASQSSVTSAMDLADARVASTIGSESVAVQGSGYVATFVYQPSGGAEGVFSVSVKTGDNVLILTDSAGALRSSAPDTTQLIGVGIDCFDDTHCDDSNACTADTCSANVCSYQNVAQGTPCDDGLFCTLTDECDGSGLCVGSDTPCNTRDPQCCEGTDQCICATCMCGQQ